MLMDRGLIFNIQRYSLHDGPGIRTTVFLKGCPLSCLWCHNPESKSGRREIRVIESRCVDCGRCVEVCPQRQQLAVGDPVPDCTYCGECVAACPTGARQMVGQEMSVGQVVSDVLRDRPFFDQSGGGVTLSGGEPLAQAAFVRRLLQALRRAGIHTALDTAGYVPTHVIIDVAPWVDLFLYDLKCVDNVEHSQQTGVSCDLILENLKTLGSIHDNIWIRVPLIPGFNMETEQLAASARYVATIPGVKQVNLLPYHRLGTGKVKPAGGASSRPVTLDISREQLDQAAEPFRAAGLHTLIGG